MLVRWQVVNVNPVASDIAHLLVGGGVLAGEFIRRYDIRAFVEKLSRHRRSGYASPQNNPNYIT
jgi:hypothetical protein